MGALRCRLCSALTCRNRLSSSRRQELRCGDQLELYSMGIVSYDWRSFGLHAHHKINITRTASHKKGINNAIDISQPNSVVVVSFAGIGGIFGNVIERTRAKATIILSIFTDRNEHERSYGQDKHQSRSKVLNMAAHSSTYDSSFVGSAVLTRSQLGLLHVMQRGDRSTHCFFYV